MTSMDELGTTGSAPEWSSACGGQCGLVNSHPPAAIRAPADRKPNRSRRRCERRAVITRVPSIVPLRIAQRETFRSANYRLTGIGGEVTVRIANAA